MGKRKSQINDKKKKINLVFDEAKRKDFLCGFRKRKLERKKKAQEELQRMLKEEKKRIKQENKESYKKLVVSSRPIPDIEQLLQEEYEDNDVNVKIVELSSDTLQKKDIVIGENRPKEKLKKLEKKEKSKDIALLEDIPGMAIDQENENEEETDTENGENDEQLKTKKEVKRILKQQATKKLQKSKVYQMKSKLESVKNRKSQKKKVKSDQRKEKSKKKNHRKNNNKR